MERGGSLAAYHDAAAAAVAATSVLGPARAVHGHKRDTRQTAGCRPRTTDGGARNRKPNDVYM